MKRISSLAFLGALVWALPCPTLAEVEIQLDVDALRSELAQTNALESFGESDGLDKDERELRAKEAALMQKISTQDIGTTTQVIERIPSGPREPPPTEIIARENEKLQSALTIREKEVATLRSKSSSVEGKLSQANRTIADLRQQLDDAKRRLLVAETEVERLSNVLTARNRSALSTFGGNPPALAPAVTESRARLSAPPATVRPEPPQPASDVPVAQVIVSKAYLRSGPSKDSAPLMSVAKGARLVVETRRGEWYRVITPQGTRAWVNTEVIAFGATPKDPPTRTFRIKGYSDSLQSAESPRRTD